MKKLMLLVKNEFNYFSAQIIFALIVYSLSLIAGVFIFKDDVISIEPSVMEFWDLLVHNTISVILIILSGFFTFGIFGNFILISNGLILARIVVGVNNNYGIGPIVKHIMPHFLFETCALILATALSYESFKFIYNITHDDVRIIKLRYVLSGIITIAILIVIAAIIESNIGVRI